MSRCTIAGDLLSVSPLNYSTVWLQVLNRGDIQLVLVRGKGCDSMCVIRELLDRSIVKEEN